MHKRLHYKYYAQWVTDPRFFFLSSYDAHDKENLRRWLVGNPETDKISKGFVLLCRYVHFSVSGYRTVTLEK